MLVYPDGIWDDFLYFSLFLLIMVCVSISYISVFQCGEVFHNSTGTFDYKIIETLNIPLTVNCTWVILAESMELIDFRFQYIHKGNGNSCELGSVKVR